MLVPIFPLTSPLLLKSSPHVVIHMLGHTSFPSTRSQVLISVTGALVHGLEPQAAYQRQASVALKCGFVLKKKNVLPLSAGILNLSLP